MKKITCLVLSVLSLTTSVAFAAAQPSPVGLWRSMDDVTHEPRAIIKITETANNTLQGTIIKIFPRPGRSENEVCTACKGKLHNQPIVGMTIMHGLKADKNPGHWKNGEILDPNNGKTYNSTVQLTDNNQKLNVRGYIGMPLFGRSQVWERVESN
jgi:uncharacterized protein (DUF2147 family)